MGLSTRFAVVLIASSIFACKPREEGSGTGLKTIDFETSEGTLLFMIAEDGAGREGVFRYFCPEGRAALATRAAVRAPDSGCSLVLPKRYPGHEMVDTRTFDRELTAKYLVSVGDQADGRLNDFESRLKRQLYRCLKTDGACDPLVAVKSRSFVAAGHYQAQLLGLMQSVLDGDQVDDVQRPEPEEGARGLQLADETGRVSLSAAKAFTIPAFSQQTTVGLRVLNGRPKVNVISFTVSEGCRARVAGVASVVADGQNLVGASQIVAQTADSFVIRRHPEWTDPMDLSRVQVVMRRTGTGPIGSCRVTLVGWAVGGDPAPSPGPNPNPNPNPAPGVCTDAKRDQIMSTFAAAPSMRHWHYLWHGIRNGWDEMSVAERQEVVGRLGAHWERADFDDNVGEEFLHMHQTMLAMVRAHLKGQGCDMYKPWTQPPPERTRQQCAGQVDCFVTFDRLTPQGGFNQMMQWHDVASSTQRLANVSMGRFGSWIESSLHNNFHMRHADPNQQSPAFNNLELFALPSAGEHALNRVTQSWLGHPYSSHVNPYFWRLHGYVDDRIFTWLTANGYKGIEGGPRVDDRNATCVSPPGNTRECYKWKRTWDGLQGNQAVAAASEPVAAPRAHHAVTEREASGFRGMSRATQRMIDMNANMFAGAPDEGERF